MLYMHLCGHFSWISSQRACMRRKKKQDYQVHLFVDIYAHILTYLVDMDREGKLNTKECQTIQSFRLLNTTVKVGDEELQTDGFISRIAALSCRLNEIYKRESVSKALRSRECFLLESCLQDLQSEPFESVGTPVKGL